VVAVANQLETAHQFVSPTKWGRLTQDLALGGELGHLDLELGHPDLEPGDLRLRRLRPDLPTRPTLTGPGRAADGGAVNGRLLAHAVPVHPMAQGAPHDPQISRDAAESANRATRTEVSKDAAGSSEDAGRLW
jgi:hypothetical protein